MAWRSATSMSSRKSPLIVSVVKGFMVVEIRKPTFLSPGLPIPKRWQCHEGLGVVPHVEIHAPEHRVLGQGSSSRRDAADIGPDLGRGCGCETSIRGQACGRGGKRRLGTGNQLWLISSTSVRFLPPLDGLPGSMIAEVVHAEGLDPPQAHVVSFSIALHQHLFGSGGFSHYCRCLCCTSASASP